MINTQITNVCCTDDGTIESCYGDLVIKSHLHAIELVIKLAEKLDNAEFNRVLQEYFLKKTESCCCNDNGCQKNNTE
jgi:hypothetical protein